MPLCPPVNLSEIDKLEALRKLDQFRAWHSLEDKRYCLVCGNLITGEQINLIGGTSGNGPLQPSCPTEGCHSIPMDWVLPTNEVLENLALREMQRGNRETATPQEDKNTDQNPIAWRFRNVARRFKWAG